MGSVNDEVLLDGKNKIEAKNTEEIRSEDMMCGVGCFKPRWLQKFAKIQSFVGFYCIVAVLSSAMNSFLGSQIPSIEKQYGLKSSSSGIMMSFNDIGYLTFILIGSSLSRYVNIPVLLFSAFVLYGMSGMLCSVPHFISVASNSITFVTSDQGLQGNNSRAATASLSSTTLPLCLPTGNETSYINSSSCPDSSAVGQSSGIHLADDSVRYMLLAFFGCSLILQGIANSIRGPFVTVYIDDNGDKNRSGFYIGVIVTFAVCGPMLGYTFGGMLSRVYVTLEDVDISPRDPRWIGAWWLGFLVFGGCSVIGAIPLILFPKYIKKPASLLEDKNRNTTTSRKEKVKDAVLSYWRILKNPVAVSLIVATVLDLGALGSYFSFLSKYIHTQFNIPLWQSNIQMAIANIGAFSIGGFFGGLITRQLKMTPRKTLGIIITFYSLKMLAFSSGFLLGCNQPEIIGPASSQSVSTVLNSSQCASNCECNEFEYFPVCGSDGLNYYSPCYAGCDKQIGGGVSFVNCTCIPDGKASSGLCESDCVFRYPFAVTSFIYGFIAALHISPWFVARIRCVEDRDKAIIVGLTSFFGSLLGLLPSPILFGKVVDSACLIWQNTCTSEGACLLYDLVDFRIKIHGVALCYMFGAFCCLSFAFYKVRNLSKWQSEDAEKIENTVNEMEIVLEKDAKDVS